VGGGGGEVTTVPTLRDALSGYTGENEHAARRVESTLLVRGAVWNQAEGLERETLEAGVLAVGLHSRQSAPRVAWNASELTQKRPSPTAIGCASDTCCSRRTLHYHTRLLEKYSN